MGLSDHTMNLWTPALAYALGATVFENNKKYQSVANQAVVFDPTLKHSGISCTDEKVRLVLNINYK